MMETFDLNKLITHSEEAHAKSVFFESSRIKAQVMGLEAGQEIPPCRMEHDVVFIVLGGRGVISADGREQAAGKSFFVFVAKETERRAIKALTKMSLLAVQIRS